MTPFPQDFTLRLKKLYSKEEQIILEEALGQVRRLTSFRVNTVKSTPAKVQSELTKAHIWYELCSIIPHCFVLTNPEDEKKLRKLEIYKNGRIYIQWISSQLPVTYFQQRPASEQTSLKILDACAAPWWKTSQLAALYPDSKIWAFESGKIRYEKMKHNFEKLGISKHNSVYDSVENISKYISQEEYFDMILVDAPCSWEWAISYQNTKFLKNWSLRHIKKNYARQKAICDAVLPYLKVWWEMIYSTCTLTPEENEAVIHYLLCKYPWIALKKLDFVENKYIKYKKALKSFWKYIFRKEISECSLRIIPSKYSEGFYIAKLRKCDFKQ